MAKKGFSRFLKAVAVVGVAALFVGDHVANAGSATSSFTVSATVIAKCTITTSNFAFGNYDPLSGADTDATNNVTLTCSKGTTWDLALDQGANPGAGSTALVPIRRMALGAEYLSYGFFRDAARTLNWGIAPNDPSGTAANKTPFTVTIYGRITAGQDVTVGAYSDTVVATVNF